jgi:hypothetical protein
VPPTYTRVSSSLGSATPRNIVVLPVLFEGETKAVIELASLQAFTQTHLTFLEQLTQSIGVEVESGTVTVEAEEIAFASLRDSIDRMFHHVAEQKNLAFRIDIDERRATAPTAARPSRSVCPQAPAPRSPRPAPATSQPLATFRHGRPQPTGRRRGSRSAAVPEHAPGGPPSCLAPASGGILSGGRSAAVSFSRSIR